MTTRSHRFRFVCTPSRSNLELIYDVKDGDRRLFRAATRYEHGVLAQAHGPLHRNKVVKLQKAIPELDVQLGFKDDQWNTYGELGHFAMRGGSELLVRPPGELKKVPIATWSKYELRDYVSNDTKLTDELLMWKALAEHSLKSYGLDCIFDEVNIKTSVMKTEDEDSEFEREWVATRDANLTMTQECRAKSDKLLNLCFSSIKR